MTHLAHQALIDFGRKYPQAKEVFTAMQSNLPKQPTKGVFASSEDAYRHDTQLALAASSNYTTTEVMANNLHARDLVCGYFWGLHLFGTWRNTMGIYHIDKDIFVDAMVSPIPEETPSIIFENLPEWSQYIQFPKGVQLNVTYADFFGKNAQRHEVLGFWATFDYAPVNGRRAKILNIVLHHEGTVRGVNGYYVPMRIELNPALSVKASLKKTLMEQLGQSYDPITSEIYSEKDIEMGLSLLSMLLFLCVEEPDIALINGEPMTREQLTRPKYAVNKKSGRFIPPSSPHFYEVGKRLGGEMRVMREQLEIAKSDTKTPRRVKPHIRKAHWHGVWRGTGQDKHFHTYWQPPVFVNGKG